MVAAILAAGRDRHVNDATVLSGGLQGSRRAVAGGCNLANKVGACVDSGVSVGIAIRKDSLEVAGGQAFEAKAKACREQGKAQSRAMLNKCVVSMF